MVDYSRRILDSVGWCGVAMVEFKVSKQGIPYLMEVNARFWGSVQLAIDAGVDFPYLMAQSMKGGVPIQPRGYTVGIRNRWLLGDVDHLLLRLKYPERGMDQGTSRLQAVAAFLNPFISNTYYDVNRWEDMGPFLRELRQYISALLGKRRYASAR